MTLHGFRLLRAGDDLRLEYGLLTRVTATIPIHRIQALTIQEGPLHRLCGRVTIRVDTAGGEGQGAAQAQRQRLAPILRRGEVEGFLPHGAARSRCRTCCGTVSIHADSGAS